MSQGLIALLIILVVIVGAITTHRCEEFMIGGSLIGAIFLYGSSFLSEWCVLLQEALTENVWIFMACGLFGSLIALLRTAKGSYGFSKIVSHICDTEKKTLLTTFVLGVLIFVDDYLNVLSIGVCMKGVYDKRKIPREALAFMLDATGAPVCVLLPFSTWAVFYASLFIEQQSVLDYGFTSGMDAYISAIPFCFYPIVILLIVVLFALGIMPKLGTMKTAYQRVAETGKVYSDASRKYNHDDDLLTGDEGNFWDFIIPMAVLVAAAIITGDLLVAAVLAIACCMVMFVPRNVIPGREFFAVIIQGFGEMLPTLALLLMAFLLEKVTSQMQLTEFIIEIAEPLLTGALFPMITFIIVAMLCFATGSFWGMSAVVAPIVFPLGAAISANPVLIMAAIISGGAFGSHACFYCDATLLSSNSAGIDNMEHAVSQLPYVAMGAAVSVVGFLVSGLMF
ncbi:MAG: hypothetical protein LUE86_00185 [Clostridiales bacterium]|nr:hypothetical protein [Clostridiales bacterium]